jgi:hypothetical protein
LRGVTVSQCRVRQLVVLEDIEDEVEVVGSRVARELEARVRAGGHLRPHDLGLNVGLHPRLAGCERLDPDPNILGSPRAPPIWK